MGNRRGLSQKWVVVICLTIILAMFSAETAEAAKVRRQPVRVKAKAAWVETKVVVTAGETVKIQAKGVAMTGPLKLYPKAKSGPGGQTWNLDCGEYEAAPPPCALTGVPYGALVGKIGSGTPFLIGKANSFTASSSGTLWLAVNDNLNAYKDNKGGFAVIFK